MISSLFNNLTVVTKNLLIINALMLLATFALEQQGINLTQLFGAHNFLSPLFEPFQIVTHFFMHGDFMHLLFNMFGLVIFGSHLERIWGEKRFFWFYIICAIGALGLYAGFGTWEMYQLQQAILADENAIFTIAELNQIIVEAVQTDQVPVIVNEIPVYTEYFKSGFVPMVGASGAIYGILVGFAYLFPNTELMLLFPPIPIKAKYLVGILMLISLYYSFNGGGSNIAHLAHLGGGIFGFIMVLLFQRDKKKFY
jgi:membrane associated rhomboid family serine protease